MNKEKLQKLINSMMQNTKILIPVAVVAAAAVTVAVALGLSGDRDGLAESEMPTETVTAEPDGGQEAGSDEIMPLVPNESAEVAELIATYYDAQANGDLETIRRICEGMTDVELLRTQENARYIDRYEVEEIYTQPGYAEGSLIAYVYTKLVFSAYPEDAYPGYQCYYLLPTENGSLYIYRGECSDEVNAYFARMASQDDVVEFNNRVTVEYKNLMMEKPELLTYLSEVDQEVSKRIGMLVAQEAQATPEPVTTTEPEDPNGGDAGAGGNETLPDSPIVLYVTATTTVNVRQSDSERADRIGKVSAGTKLQLVEHKGNGWSHIIYEGSDGYIKSEYLQNVESAEGVATIGTVTAETNVNVRASASETADKVGVLAGGETVDLIIAENGWCKIKYNGQIAFVKEEFVTRN